MKSVLAIATILGLAFLTPLSGLAENGADSVAAKATQSKKKRKSATYLETGGERKLDIVYKRVGKRELELDLYLPTGNRDGAAPLVIYTHGGGWAAGSRAGATKGSFALLFKELLADGFAVASVDYRLYKKEGAIRMRDCVIDSKDAVRYLAKNSGSLGLDPGQFFVFGDSAGGHIAQMLLLSPSESLTGDAGLAETPYTIVAGLSWYGPSDFENIDLFNHDDRPDFRDRFGPRITGENFTPNEKSRLYTEMSPVTYLGSDSPPLFMIQGDRDTTIPVKHARHMEKRAKEIQAPVEILIVKNAGHNWRKVGADIEPGRDEIIRASAEFFRRFADGGE